MVLKIPKQAVETKKKRRIGSTIHCDYLKVSEEESEGLMDGYAKDTGVAHSDSSETKMF